MKQSCLSHHNWTPPLQISGSAPESGAHPKSTDEWVPQRLLRRRHTTTRVPDFRALSNHHHYMGDRHLIRCNYVHTVGNHRGRMASHQTPDANRDQRKLQHLYASDSIVIYKDRIVIPPSLRNACLTALHAAHQSTSAITARAEAAIFWPGITSDIHQTRSSCSTCYRMASSQAALPPTQPTPSEYPFQCVCADYFHYKGYAYLVIVDR